MARARVCGVYCVVHLATGRRYVGESKDVAKRIVRHLCGVGGGHYLARAIAKYGRAAFVWGLVEECESEAAALQREQHWIGVFGCITPAGFNLTSGGEAPKMSAATLQKLRETHLGKTQTAQAKQKVSEATKGRRHSPEAIEKMRRAHQNRSPEHAANVAAALRARNVSPKHIDQIRAALQGRAPSEKCQRACRAANTGRVRATDESRRHSDSLRRFYATPEGAAAAKLRGRARTGTHHTEATKKKISEAKRALFDDARRAQLQAALAERWRRYRAAKAAAAARHAA